MGDRKWKVNPGTKKGPNKPETKVWLKFRAVDQVTGKHIISATKVRAGDYIWLHRGWHFDILEATDED